MACIARRKGSYCRPKRPIPQSNLAGVLKWWGGALVLVAYFQLNPRLALGILLNSFKLFPKSFFASFRGSFRSLSSPHRACSPLHILFGLWLAVRNSTQFDGKILNSYLEVNARYKESLTFEMQISWSSEYNRQYISWLVRSTCRILQRALILLQHTQAIWCLAYRHSDREQDLASCGYSINLNSNYPPRSCIHMVGFLCLWINMVEHCS